MIAVPVSSRVNRHRRPMLLRQAITVLQRTQQHPTVTRRMLATVQGHPIVLDRPDDDRQCRADSILCFCTAYLRYLCFLLSVVCIDFQLQ